MKQIFFITILALMSFCAWAEKIEIKSNPEEAEIYVLSDESSVPQKIGKTPFKQDLKELIQTYVKKSNFVLELRKDGYEPYRVLFTKTSNIDVELSVNMEVSREIQTIKKHDLLMVELFDVQKLIRGKNFADAQNKLNELEKRYPHFSIIAELKATNYYMQKDVEKALSYYRKSFALNSDNVDSYKMKVYLEKKLGIDTEKN